MAKVPSKNAMTHGLYASDVVLPGESQQEFDNLLQSIRAELEPDGASEEHEVFEVFYSHFVMGRIRRLSQEAMQGDARVVQSLLTSSAATVAADNQRRQESFERARGILPVMQQLFDLILQNVERQTIGT